MMVDSIPKKLKKSKTSQDFEHAKSKESRNENGGVEPYGARPEMG